MKRLIKVCQGCDSFVVDLCYRSFVEGEEQLVPYYGCHFGNEGRLSTNDSYEYYPVPKECQRLMEQIVIGHKP